MLDGQVLPLFQVPGCDQDPHGCDGGEVVLAGSGKRIVFQVERLQAGAGTDHLHFNLGDEVFPRVDGADLRQAPEARGQGDKRVVRDVHRLELGAL